MTTPRCCCATPSTTTDGKIALALTGQSDLQIDGTVTLENGEVELNTSGDEITALATGAKLENSANIHGQGQIGAGDGKLTFDNLLGGVVDADQAARPSISTPATPSRIMERWRHWAAVRSRSKIPSSILPVYHGLGTGFGRRTVRSHPGK